MDKCTRCGKEAYHNNLCESCLVALDKWNTIHEIELIEDQGCEDTHSSIILNGKPMTYLEYREHSKKYIEYEVNDICEPNELICILDSFGVMYNLTHKEIRRGKLVKETKYTNRSN